MRCLRFFSLTFKFFPFLFSQEIGKYTDSVLDVDDVIVKTEQIKLRGNDYFLVILDSNYFFFIIYEGI